MKRPMILMAAKRCMVNPLFTPKIKVKQMEKVYLTIAAGLLITVCFGGTTEADIIYERPSHTGSTWKMSAMDDDMYFGLLVEGDSDQNFFGTGRLDLFSVSLSIKNQFEFGFINPTTLTLPDTWSSSYNNSNGNLTIFGELLPGGYNIDFTFDPTNVAFGRTDFNYDGLVTSGTLPDVDTLTVVPVPSAIILGSLGLTFSGWLLHRKKTT